MRVWLVWSGEYSGADVIGVYSTRELAEAAARMSGRSSFTDTSDGYISPADGIEVDADAAMVSAGVSRWRVDIEVESGAVTWINELGIGTNEPITVTRERLPASYGSAVIIVRGVTPIVEPERDGPKLIMYLNAAGKDHAVKIAGDERAKYLALTTV